ncbi:mitotic spindle assembly checkpoint protein MAD1-like [Schistocerca gregaria]|uniref:mitotic spindle assembly checkpoint protein MAD1-like n=1 Tax=Schistocerca gregaria TaxID=7010 RepID=UPI00211F3EF9|nr:mitotic spindle assembly checkpoint protein MAD1-like [Schistocerca gregaria]
MPTSGSIPPSKRPKIETTSPFHSKFNISSPSSRSAHLANRPFPTGILQNSPMIHSSQKSVHAELDNPSGVIESQQALLEKLESQLKLVITERDELAREVNTKESTIRAYEKARGEIEQKNLAAQIKVEENEILNKAQVKKLESDIAVMKKEISALTARIAKMDGSMREVENQNQNLEKCKLEYQAQNSLLESKHNISLVSMERLKKELEELKYQKDLQEQDFRDKMRHEKLLVSSLRQEISTYEAKISKTIDASSKVQELEQVVQHQNSRILELENIISEQDNRLSAFKSLSNHLEKVEQLEHQCKNLNAELQMLRARESNIALLKEQLKNAQLELQVMKESTKDFTRNKLELEKLSIENASMKSLLGEIEGMEESASIKEVLKDLNCQSRRLMNQNGVLNAENKRYKAMVEILETNNKDLQMKVLDLKELLRSSEESVRHKEVIIQVLEDEKKGLNELLDSYQSSAESSYDELKVERAKQLQEQVERKDEMIEELQKAMKEYKNRLFQAERQNRKVWDEKQTLEHRLGRGDYNREEVRVVHLAVTPAMIMERRKNEAELNQWRAQAESLRKQLEMVQDNNAITVAMSQWTKLQSEVEELKYKNREHEVYKNRLLTMFKSKVDIFKAVVCHVFGWTIELDEKAGQVVKIRSVYSLPKDDEYLMFCYQKNQMIMLESPFSKSLDESITSLLSKKHSLAGVVGKITVSMFEKYRCRTR